MSCLLLHEPRRGIGGKAARSHAASGMNLPSGGRFSNITDDVRKFAPDQAISEEEALKKEIEDESKEFVEKGAEVNAKVCCLSKTFSKLADQLS